MRRIVEAAIGIKWASAPKRRCAEADALAALYERRLPEIGGIPYARARDVTR